jgi:hypothetical protein
MDSPTVHLFEHLKHLLNVVMVQEPSLRVSLVLLERDTERVCDVDCLPIVLTKEDADNALIRGA